MRSQFFEYIDLTSFFTHDLFPSHSRRNELLAKKGFPAPTAQKTGTTIVGIVYKDGVILGADTRATENTIVSDKNCSKIHFLASNI